jgi:hypothetical protein
MPDFLLSFEVDDTGSCLEIHGDPKGLERLGSLITKLIVNTKDGYFDHDHWMTPAWGGDELSQANKGGKVFEHVKIYCWKGDKFQS